MTAGKECGAKLNACLADMQKIAIRLFCLNTECSGRPDFVRSNANPILRFPVDLQLRVSRPPSFSGSELISGRTDPRDP